MKRVERLTKRDRKGHAYFDDDGSLIRGANGTFHQKKDMTAQFIHQRFVALDKAIDRLAAYEDAGLMPDEMDALRASFEALRDDASPLLLAKAEDRLIVLPCRPDAVFFQWKKGDDCPSVSSFEGVKISEDGKITYPMERWGETFTLDDFGKTVFLSRSEAETKRGKEDFQP